MRRYGALAAALGVLLGAVVTVAADRASDQEALLRAVNEGSPVQVYPVRGGIYLLVGDAAEPNITISAGDEGVLVVDAGTGARSGDVLDAVRRVSTRPIRYLISTTSRAEHVGGNAAIAGAGQGFEGVASLGATPRATGIAHENVLKRLTGQGEPSAASVDAWPTLAFHTRRKELHFNGETVQVIHQPNALTDGDSVVFFRSSDVVAAGDLFLTTTYPVIDVGRGGTIDGVIAALNAIIDITNTRKNQEGGTLVIPGHGRVSDEADVVEYRDMLAIVRGRVQHYVDQKLSLEQILAERPTIDFDGRYAAPSGPASARSFIDVVHQGVLAAVRRTRS